MSSDHDRAHPLSATLSRLLLVVSSLVLPERLSRVVLQLRELLATVLVGELRSSAVASLTKRTMGTSSKKMVRRLNLKA
jgi:hypothetical protein